MLYYLLCSMKRRKTKNLITIGISMALVALLSLYFGNMRSYQMQLEDFAKTVPVYCQITNLNGNRTSGLFISDNIVQGIKTSDHTVNESFLVSIMAGEGDFTPAQWVGNLNLFVDGANRIEAVPGMTEDIIHLDKGNIQDFFLSDRPECIVNERVMEKRGWQVGDKILLNFYYYIPDNSRMSLDLNPLELTEIEIVGTMEDFVITTTATFPDIVMPIETICGMYMENDIAFFADTVTFQVKDPLRLNEFKEEMKGFDLLETASAKDSYSGIALTVKDRNFISMASDLRRAIEYMEIFLPVVIVMVLVVGYVVSSLLGSSRMEEYTFLRLQGVGRRKGAAGFWAEQILLVLVGIIIGNLCIYTFFPEVLTLAVVNGVLLTAYMVGAAAAYVRMSKDSVIGLLSGRQ